MTSEKSKRVTIYDIAASLGISSSTVSRVLSKADYPVNSELKDRIRQAAKEMNYYPNLSARNLKKQNSCHVGIVVPSISNPFYPSILRGIEDVAYEHGYFLFVCSGDGDTDREQRYLNLLIENDVCGLITLFFDPVVEGLSGYLQQGGIVASVSSERSEYKNICSFYFDKQLEGCVATQHLLELGHKHIAFLTAPLTNATRQGKVMGYLSALQDAGIQDEKKYLTVAAGEMDMDSSDRVDDCQMGVELTRKLLMEHPEVTAILCMNDLATLGCISELASRGLRVPEDYSVMGFDDSFFSNLVKPSITTMRSDKYKIGQFVMEKFIKIKEQADPIRQYDMSSYSGLVVRDSTGRPRG